MKEAVVASFKLVWSFENRFIFGTTWFFLAVFFVLDVSKVMNTYSRMDDLKSRQIGLNVKQDKREANCRNKTAVTPLRRRTEINDHFRTNNILMDQKRKEEGHKVYDL